MNYLAGIPHAYQDFQTPECMRSDPWQHRWRYNESRTERDCVYCSLGQVTFKDQCWDRHGKVRNVK